ncbi:MAG: NYN domain-containing protein [Actinomycetota bacterium]
MWEKDTLGLLQPVIESARKELSDMEFDDIPIALRRVEKSSARRLPPPLARTVVDELVGNDRFRASVHERYTDTSDVDEDLDAFLVDPEDGLVRLEGRVKASRTARGEGELRSANARIDRLTSQLAEAKRRFEAQRKSHASELADARDASVKDSARLRRRGKELGNEIAALKSQVSDLEEVVVELRQQIADAETAMAKSNERARKRAVESSNAARKPVLDGMSSNPLEFAQWLDTIERNARPYRQKEMLAVDESVRPLLQVPAGVAPDSGTAMGALIDQRPRSVILDGYNIAGHLHGEEFATRDARDDVIERAGRLARRTSAEIIVVFDGPDDEERREFRSADGISVRFSRGEKADDLIAGMVRDDPDRIVVISSDRELRERCTIPGCVPVWSSAFLDWR